MTAREEILAYLEAHPGEQTTTAISAACEASQSSVYATLSALASTGEITRVATGRYQLTDGTKAAKRETKAAQSATNAAEAATPPPISASEEPTEPDAPLDVPELLQMGIWSTGELTLARGEQSILLAPSEVREMVQFLDRVGAVAAGAV